MKEEEGSQLDLISNWSNKAGRRCFVNIDPLTRCFTSIIIDHTV